MCNNLSDQFKKAYDDILIKEINFYKPSVYGWIIDDLFTNFFPVTVDYRIPRKFKKSYAANICNYYLGPLKNLG